MTKRNSTKIDDKFIECKRLNFYGIINYIFDDEDKNFEIVPKEFTHEYLLSNFIINKNIKEYYFASCVNLISDEEFQKEVERGYCGKKETMLMPYNYIFFGAYFSRNSLYYKLLSLQYHKDLLLNGKKIKYFQDLIPYFKKYAKGFEKGYNEFENECVKKYLNEYSDKNDFSKKVFEYVTKRVLSKHDWLNNGNSSFQMTNHYDSDIETITGAFEHGKEQGYFYRAWSIIFSNNDLYEPYFEKLKVSPIQKTKSKQIINSIVKACETIIDSSTIYNVYKEDYKKGKQRENSRTIQIVNFLKQNEYFHTETQHETGLSETKKSIGIVDFAFLKNGTKFSIGEAINWSSYNQILRDHINKLQDNYNQLKLPFLIFPIYFEGKPNEFSKKYEYFYNKLKKDKSLNFPCESIKDITKQFTDNNVIKIAETEHKYSKNNKFSMFHIFIDFSKE